MERETYHGDPPEHELSEGVFFSKSCWWRLTFVKHSLDVQPIVLLDCTVVQFYPFGDFTCKTWRYVLPSV